MLVMSVKLRLGTSQAEWMAAAIDFLKNNADGGSLPTLNGRMLHVPSDMHCSTVKLLKNFLLSSRQNLPHYIEMFFQKGYGVSRSHAYAEKRVKCAERLWLKLEEAMGPPPLTQSFMKGGSNGCK